LYTIDMSSSSTRDLEARAKRKAEKANAEYERLVRQRIEAEQKEKDEKTLDEMVEKYGSLEKCVLGLLKEKASGAWIRYVTVQPDDRPPCPSDCMCSRCYYG
jgi:hypothetical protein